MTPVLWHERDSTIALYIYVMRELFVLPLARARERDLTFQEYGRTPSPLLCLSTPTVVLQYYFITTEVLQKYESDTIQLLLHYFYSIPTVPPQYYGITRIVQHYYTTAAVLQQYYYSDTTVLLQQRERSHIATTLLLQHSHKVVAELRQY